MALPASRARSTVPMPAPAARAPVRSTAAVPSRAPSPPRLTPAPTSGVLTAGSRVTAALGAGEPLAPSILGLLERGFGADLSGIRVHQGDAATRTARAVGARAFATGTHIVLGAGESPRDIDLMAHEVTHVLQQGGPAVQPFTRGAAGGFFEREAQHAAAVVAGGGAVGVAPVAGVPAVQGLGVSDALDFFAERANAVPGFRMFTIVLGVNPINMSRVERSAANILRALIEFIPGGALIRMALDNYGIFERVGGWLEEQIRAFGMSGNSIRQALDRFVGSLGLGDLFDLGGVWERAKRIFSEPIDRILGAVASFGAGILRLIKDAVLRPLARLAEGTRGYDLLKAVLGRDPITGEAVPRNAETLIGGFMRLIGQEEVWENLQRSRAVPRAWTWFQGALEGLLGFVREFPGLVVRAFQTLELADVVLLPRAFTRIGNVFGGFAGRFFGWAGAQVMSLLQIIFEVLAPPVMPYINRAASAFRTIVSDPIRFIGNLVRAGIQGFRQFAAHFLTHLRTSLIGWLTGTMAGANIYVPQAFTVLEILKFVLSVLGLTWQNIRAKLVRQIGETAVRVLETGFDIVVTLVRDGPAAAWQKILEAITNLREMAMEAIMNFVRDRIVQAAITRLVTSLNPAGAFIQAVIAIYNTIMFFVERLRQIGQVVASFIDSISAIASGVIQAAADRVERTMGGLLTLVVSFLARLVGLGRVSDAVSEIINRIRAPIDRALDRVVEWIVGQARRLGRAVASGARRLVEWWRARKQFRTPSGESHALYFTGSGASARLTIASDPVNYRDFINRLDLTPAQASQKTAALRIADALDDAIRLAGAGGATAADPSAAIERLLDNLAQATLALLPSGANPTSPSVFGPLTTGFGTSARVARLTRQHPDGGEPTVDGGLWNALRRRQDGGGSYYVRGHLLNHNLGGPGGSWTNLTPLTQNANNRALDSMLREFETPVKTRVDALTGNQAVNFEVTARYGRSHPLMGLVPQLRTSSSPDDHTIADIIEAERSVPLTIVCRSFNVNAAGRETTRIATATTNNTVRDSRLADYQLTPRPKQPLVISGATPAELQRLDGVTAAMAQAIARNASYRTSQQVRDAAGMTDAQWQTAVSTPAYYVRLFTLG
jgi:hypothetical protein